MESGIVPEDFKSFQLDGFVHHVLSTLSTQIE